MGVGINETGQIARGTRTGADFVIKAADVLSLLLSAGNTKEERILANWVTQEHGSIKCDKVIPVAKIAEFTDEMKARDIPFMLATKHTGHVIIGPDQNMEDIKEELEEQEVEYVTVVYRGPKYQVLNNGEMAQNADGSLKAVGTTNHDAEAIDQIVNQINFTYKHELEELIKEQKHELSTETANEYFKGKKVVQIPLESLTEAHLVQRQLNKNHINSHILKVADGYELEFEYLWTLRADADRMSPVEKALCDAKIGLSVPVVQDYVKLREHSVAQIAEQVSNIDQGNFSNKKIMILSVNNKFPNRNYMEKFSQSIKLDGPYAHLQYKEYPSNRMILESIDLRTKEGFEKFENALDRIGDATVVDYDKFVTATRSDALYQEFKDTYEIDKLNQTVKSYKDIQKEAFNFTSNIYSVNKEVAKDILPDLGHLVEIDSDDPDRSGHRMMEFRIENSAEVIADTVMKDAKTGAIDKDSFIKNLKDKQVGFTITESNIYQEVTEYVTNVQGHVSNYKIYAGLTNEEYLDVMAKRVEAEENKETTPSGTDGQETNQDNEMSNPLDTEHQNFDPADDGPGNI